VNASKISARLRAAGLPVAPSRALSELDGIRVTSEAGRVAVRVRSRSDATEAVLVSQAAGRELDAAGYAVTRTPGMTTLWVADPLTEELGLTRAARAAVVALLNGESVKLIGTVRATLERVALVSADGTLNSSTARSLDLRVAPSADNAFTRRPAVHRFRTTGDAYNASQTDSLIANGDVLVALDEHVIGVLMQAWPVAITGVFGDFHTMPTPGAAITQMIDAEGSAGIAFADGVIEAIAVARSLTRNNYPTGHYVRANAFADFEARISCPKCLELIDDAALFESYDTPAGLCAECAAFEREIATGK
jgi:hypothetical protein